MKVDVNVEAIGFGTNVQFNSTFKRFGGINLFVCKVLSDLGRKLYPVARQAVLINKLFGELDDRVGGRVEAATILRRVPHLFFSMLVRVFPRDNLPLCRRKCAPIVRG